jgi:tetratricopeptide (TPR) repeat protein
MPDGRSVRVSMSRRQLGQMLTVGALRGIPPAGVLGVDDADWLTQAIAHPRRVDQQVIEYFQRLLAEHYDLDILEEQAATCYRNVGRPQDAIPIFERMIAALPANLHRDRGHQMAKLANAVIATKQPEPDRAARLRLACLDLARYTGSARISKELHTFDVALRARWPDQPDTWAFHDALAAS